MCYCIHILQRQSFQEQYIPMTEITTIPREVLPDYTPPSSPLQASAPVYSSPYSFATVSANSPSVISFDNTDQTQPLNLPSPSYLSPDNVAEREVLITPTAISALRPPFIMPRPLPFTLSPEINHPPLQSPRSYKKKLRSHKSD